MFDVLAFAVQAHNFAAGDLNAFDKPVAISGLHEKAAPPPVVVTPAEADGYEDGSPGPASIGIFIEGPYGDISGYASSP